MILRTFQNESTRESQEDHMAVPFFGRQVKMRIRTIQKNSGGKSQDAGIAQTIARRDGADRSAESTENNAES